MKIILNFLEISKFQQNYIDFAQNYILNCHAIPINLTIVGKEFVRITEREKEKIDGMEIKYFLLEKYENEEVVYNEIFLEPVKTDNRQTKLW